MVLNQRIQVRQKLREERKRLYGNNIHKRYELLLL